MIATKDNPIGSMPQKRQGFTLVEILIVIAISILLFGLLLRPLIQSLSFTREAQIMSAAQDAGRQTIEMLTRELGTAQYVFDNQNHPIRSGANNNLGYIDDRYTNFLNLEVPKSDGSPVIAQAFNAKLDFVVPRHNTTGGLLDPTAGNEPIQLRNSTSGSAIVTSADLVFPLAPGTTMIRYFIGLQNPTMDPPANKTRYSDTNEAALTSGSTNNTYVLYRAQFVPYIAAANATTSVTTYQMDPTLLPWQGEYDGISFDPTKAAPELDDPDFFRIVTPGVDINWLSADHHVYTNTEANDPQYGHNMRVQRWQAIAKPVITAPQIDLLVLPRNNDGSIAFDSGTNDPQFGYAYDPITAIKSPIVKTSITFNPGTITADASPSTTSDYANAGVPNSPANNSGLSYIPAVYRTANQSWSNPWTVNLYPNNYTGVETFYDVTVAQTDGTLNGQSIYAGDALENIHPASGAAQPIYDVTQGQPLLATSDTLYHDYIPMSIAPDTGTINFAVRAGPPSAVQPSPTTYYTYTAADVIAGNQSGTTPPTPGLIDLTKSPDSNNVTTPLSPPNVISTDVLTGNQVRYAHIVPGSMRVFGPDANKGPNYGNSVAYTECFEGEALQPNQYQVDYVAGTVTLFQSTGSTLPEKKNDTVTAADPVTIYFDYQANLRPGTITSPISTTNIALPMKVQVDYQTRDIVDAHIGVRIYSPTTHRAQIIALNSKIKVGNSNR